uniref:Link domain-containing protein n=1 Tax=Cyprinus carpio TaxID=7962 RepID=A0A8C1X7V1_CYPCA
LNSLIPSPVHYLSLVPLTEVLKTICSSGRCSFASVFHVEGTSRYSLTFQQALELCQSLGYKLATHEQVNEAYKKDLRTCR